MGDITRNYSYWEFACKCGCGLKKINPMIAIIMEIARHFEGDKPLSCNSGCRCRDHNENVQKEYNKNYVSYSSTSTHMECIAVDIPSKDPKGLYDLLDSLFPNMFGIGLYHNRVHFDLRRSKVRWDKT